MWYASMPQENGDSVPSLCVHFWMCINFEFLRFYIRFIFIIISLAIFLRPNAQLNADLRITIWCLCERVRYRNSVVAFGRTFCVYHECREQTEKSNLCLPKITYHKTLISHSLSRHKSKQVSFQYVCYWNSNFFFFSSSNFGLGNAFSYNLYVCYIYFSILLFAQLCLSHIHALDALSQSLSRFLHRSFTIRLCVWLCCSASNHPTNRKCYSITKPR